MMKSRHDTLLKHPNAVVAMGISLLGLIVFVFVVAIQNSPTDTVRSRNTSTVQPSVAGVQIERPAITQAPNIQPTVQQQKVRSTKPTGTVLISPDATVVEQTLPNTTTSTTTTTTPALIPNG